MIVPFSMLEDIMDFVRTHGGWSRRITSELVPLALYEKNSHIRVWSLQRKWDQSKAEQSDIWYNHDSCYEFLWLLGEIELFVSSGEDTLATLTTKSHTRYISFIASNPYTLKLAIFLLVTPSIATSTHKKNPTSSKQKLASVLKIDPQLVNIQKRNKKKKKSRELTLPYRPKPSTSPLISTPHQRHNLLTSSNLPNRTTRSKFSNPNSIPYPQNPYFQILIPIPPGHPFLSPLSPLILILIPTNQTKQTSFSARFPFSNLPKMLIYTHTYINTSALFHTSEFNQPQPQPIIYTYTDLSYLYHSAFLPSFKICNRKFREEEEATARVPFLLVITKTVTRWVGG